MSMQDLSFSFDLRNLKKFNLLLRGPTFLNNSKDLKLMYFLAAIKTLNLNILMFEYFFYGEPLTCFDCIIMGL